MLRRHIPAARDLEQSRSRLVELRDHLLSIASMKYRDELVATSFPDFMAQFANRFANDESWHKSRMLPPQCKNLHHYVQQAKALDGATPHDIFAAMCICFVDSSYPLPRCSRNVPSEFRTFLCQVFFLLPPSSSEPPSEWLHANDVTALVWSQIERILQCHHDNLFPLRVRSLKQHFDITKNIDPAERDNFVSSWYGVDVFMTANSHRKITSMPIWDRAPKITRLDGPEIKHPSDMNLTASLFFFDDATLAAATCLREGIAIVLDTLDWHQDDKPDNVNTVEEKLEWLRADVKNFATRKGSYLQIGFLRAVCRALGIYRDTVKYLLSNQATGTTIDDRFDYTEIKAAIRQALFDDDAIQNVDAKDRWFHKKSRLNIVFDGKDYHPWLKELFDYTPYYQDLCRDVMFDIFNVEPNQGAVHCFSGRYHLQKINMCTVLSEKRREVEQHVRLRQHFFHCADEDTTPAVVEDAAQKK